MDWSNRFTFEGFIVSYSSFQMAWEVVEEKGAYEVAFRWFPSKQKVEDFYHGRIGKKLEGNYEISLFKFIFLLYS